MRSGDLLEGVAAACLIAASWFGLGLPVALLAAGIVLAYFAQVYDKDLRVPEWKLPRLKRYGLPVTKEPRRVTWVCDTCLTEVPQGEKHKCGKPWWRAG